MTDNVDLGNFFVNRSIICYIYIITRVHSSFSLAKNRDLLEDRRIADAILVTSHAVTTICRALFCKDRDMSNGVRKSSSH